MCHELLPTPESAKTVANYISLFTDVFLRLIKMIIAPLVFSTLVVGIAHMGDTKSIGRIGLKTMGWFITASLMSLVLGMVIVNLLRPGDSLNLPLPDASASTNLKVASLSLKEFVTHLVPRSVFEALATNEILQIVVFSVFFGARCGVVRRKGRRGHRLGRAGVARDAEGDRLRDGARADRRVRGDGVDRDDAGARHPVDLRQVHGRVLSSASWSCGDCSSWPAFSSSARASRRLVTLIREPILLAFSTASSEAAYPKTLEQLERFGASKKITSFVLPLGYSFNLDGSMMYCTFATLFIAQAYGIELDLGQQITMLLILMVTSKGMAGVPRASLVVIAATLATFNIPEAGLLLIMGIDQFLDMGRSATNVVGNSIATAVVAKWEGELRPEGEAQRGNRSRRGDRGGARMSHDAKHPMIGRALRIDRIVAVCRAGSARARRVRRTRSASGSSRGR